MVKSLYTNGFLQNLISPSGSMTQLPRQREPMFVNFILQEKMCT